MATCHAGGLSEGITALRQLARLRLSYVVTEKLTDAVSLLTALTSLGLDNDDYLFGGLQPTLLPGSASALTGLRQLDIGGSFLPTEIRSLTGRRALTEPRMPT